MRARTSGWAAGAVTALLIAGCGGGGDEAPSKADYIKKADAICQSNDAEAKRLSGQANAQLAAGNFKAGAASLREAADVARKTFNEVKALDLPSDGADQVEALFASSEKGFTSLDETIGVIETGDVPKIKAAVAETAKLNEETDRLAAAFGFQQCGRRN